MDILSRSDQEPELWRSGVTTLPLCSAVNGGKEICIFEQICDPGCGAPMHVHPVEEVLEVIEGRAEVFVGEERGSVGAEQSVLIPAGARHGFTNSGQGALRVRATLAMPFFEAVYEGASGVKRRWAQS